MAFGGIANRQENSFYSLRFVRCDGAMALELPDGGDEFLCT